MLRANLWRKLIGVDHGVVIEDVEIEAADGAQASSSTCACARTVGVAAGAVGRAPGHDQGEGRRRWRSLDLGSLRCLLEADAPSVACPAHRPTVALVPWARHGAGHTRAFDGLVAWLATHRAKSTVCELLRVA